MRLGQRIVAAFCVVCLLPTPSIAQPAPTVYGAESPQAVVAALQLAVKNNDALGVMAFIAPMPRREFAAQIVSALLIFFRVANPDDHEPGDTPPSKRELDAKRKAYRAAANTARKTLKPYGLDKIIGRQAMEPETERMIASAVAKIDTVMLLRTMASLTEQIGPTLGMKRGDNPTLPLELGTVTNYQIDGDRATARNARETLEFQRVAMRWYLSSSTMLKARER
jgi:hypothetical protein